MVDLNQGHCWTTKGSQVPGSQVSLDLNQGQLDYQRLTGSRFQVDRFHFLSNQGQLNYQRLTGSRFQVHRFHLILTGDN